MKVHITKITIADKDKQGNPLINPKSNKPYWRIGMQTQEHKDQWLSGFANSQKDVDYWKGMEGKEVDIEIEEKVSGDRTFLNFKVPRLDAKEGIEQILTNLDALKNYIEQQFGEFRQLLSERVHIANGPADTRKPQQSQSQEDGKVDSGTGGDLVIAGSADGEQKGRYDKDQETETNLGAIKGKIFARLKALAPQPSESVQMLYEISEILGNDGRIKYRAVRSVSEIKDLEHAVAIFNVLK